MSDIRPVLHLGCCIVRPFRASDLAALQAAGNDPSITLYMRDRMPYPFTEADAAAWLRIARAEGLPPWKQGDPGPAPAPLNRLILAICVPDPAVESTADSATDSAVSSSSSTSSPGTCIGCIGLEPFGDDATDRLTRELGYWIGSAYWGRGIVRAAASGLARWAFSSAGSKGLHLPPGELLERLDGWVCGGNTGSARVLEACGFVREGVRRRAFIKKGVVDDMVIYGLVRSDLEAPEKNSV